VYTTIRDNENFDFTSTLSSFGAFLKNQEIGVDGIKCIATECFEEAKKCLAEDSCMDNFNCKKECEVGD